MHANKLVCERKEENLAPDEIFYKRKEENKEAKILGKIVHALTCLQLNWLVREMQKRKQEAKLFGKTIWKNYQRCSLPAGKIQEASLLSKIVQARILAPNKCFARKTKRRPADKWVLRKKNKTR